MDERLKKLESWLQARLNIASVTLAPASSDASFRRYFRVWHKGMTFVAMDAPPEREDVARFVRLAKALGAAGLNVPQVFEEDYELGFLLLSDLGTQSYLSALTATSADALYSDAISALLRLQKSSGAAPPLPSYDRALLTRELGIFPQWYIERHLSIDLADSERAMLDATFQTLIASALEQPVVWVHRDYHSRNLMVTERDNPGVLDFQDAVLGPITYDLVSLLRDCYINWPRDQVQTWVASYLARARAGGLLGETADAQFMRWFDFMGVQRHLKAIGIFARLQHRDGKPGYLADIPRTLAYVNEVCAQHAELKELGSWLASRIPFAA